VKEFEVEGMNLSDLDKKIVLLLQDGLPVCERPYRAFAEELGVTEEFLVDRLKKMKEVGFIRKNAVATNHYKLGYTANAMSVWTIEDEKLEQAGLLFKELGFISHCYERPKFAPVWNYNLFAMVHGKSREEVSEKIDLMKQTIKGLFQNTDLIYSTKILKKTGIRLKE